jgi:hypothetical protein
MRNLERCQIIEDRSGKVQYQVYGHGHFADSDLYRIIAKKSLWEPAGKVTLYNTTYRVVKIIAADGWEDAE